MENIFNTVFLFSLYAEIHSNLPFIPNILNNKIPEIIADAPIRINKNCKLPVLILVKDADKYPFELLEINAEITKNGSLSEKLNFFKGREKVVQKVWYELFYIDTEIKGKIYLDVLFKIRIKNKTIEFKNNSYRFSKKKSLEIYISENDLPDSKRIIYGDIHTHSIYTDDVSEFGAPLKAIFSTSQAIGLSFICITDHSYDLDDCIDNCLKNNPNLPKWNTFLKESKSLNNSCFTLISGIEVSVGNYRNKNVHLLIINPKKFYPGSGDSAEIWFKNKPDNNLKDILFTIDNSELAIAAHPFDMIPFLQRLLLKRDRWHLKDFEFHNLNCLQILNGINNRNFKNSLKKWTKLLLKNKKLFICAGNDSHGNFNRFIQIGLPFIKLKENKNQLLGKMKTGIFSDKLLKTEQLIDKLKNGKCFITSGPSIYFYLYNDEKKLFSGDSGSMNNPKIFAEFNSIKEFGKIDKISIILGDLIKKKEVPYIEKVENFNALYDGILPFSDLPDKFYIRTECKTKYGFAYSNPVWISNC